VLVRTPDRGDWTTTIGTGTYRGNDPVQVADHIRVGSNTKTAYVRDSLVSQVVLRNALR